MRVKKTYALPVDFEQEEDGSWSVDIPALGVCAASGYTREEALEALQDLTQVYFEVLLEFNDPLPKGIESYEINPSSANGPEAEVVTISI